ncbi:hypothetical protein B4U79_19164 [Dinothrombium tinctorium]|uniref:WAP domain-containing protein n=1 Tax=Dinothrombium tinctorium TaxID=1965070 RepID=A0A443QEM1_9ACAR|nr:hypothetical protein B4U79_19164 [Dinothrombium tinctorium]
MFEPLKNGLILFFLIHFVQSSRVNYERGSKFVKINSNLVTRSACRTLWFNRCEYNFECCSKFCFKESNWQYGVCKPNSEANQISCKPLWYNQCIHDSECCTENCEKKPNWRFGICGPNRVMIGRKGECREVGYQFCQENSECCSRKCVRDKEWLYGYCAAPESTSTQELGAEVSDDGILSRIESKECGVSQVLPIHLRIIGGRNTTPDEYPWQEVMI